MRTSGLAPHHRDQSLPLKMKLLLLFVAVSALVVTSSATKLPPINSAAIAGYWGSSEGGTLPYDQRFACTASVSPIQKAVVCTGINNPDPTTYPIPPPVETSAVIAVGQRITVPGVRLPTYQLDFSGEFGGTYILVAYNSNTIVNFTPGQQIPSRIPSDLSDLFVWKLISK